MAKKSYSEKLKDPRWQKKRLEILERDGWACQGCYDTEKTLHVHHGYYESGLEPWAYLSESLITLCEECHFKEKDFMLEECDALIRNLKKKGFTHAEILNLNECLPDWKFFHVKGVVLGVLNYFMQDQDFQVSVLNQYFELKKNLEK